MRKIAVALVGLMMVGTLAVPAIAQEDQVRLDLDFKSESLNQILQMFRRGYGLEYTLGENVDPNKQITTHLRDVTLKQALDSIMEPNGLLAVEQNGRYVIRERPEPQEREVQSRTVTPAYAAQGRTPPAPTRAVRDYEPRRGAVEAEGEDGEEERDEVMEIIWPMHLGADMGASIFGGEFIEAGGYFGGGSGGSSGSSYGGSSNRGGSNFGGSSSNRGGSSFGSSSNRGGSSYGGSSSSRSGSSRSNW